MDTALTPAQVMINPDEPQYHAENRLWQGIPSMERTPGGRLYVNFYTGMKTEESGNFVVLVSSDDNGRTWHDAQMVVAHQDPMIRVFDPALWLDPLGRLWFTWTQSRTFFDGRDGVWAIISTNPDDAHPSWSQPRRIANGLMMNKPTVCRNGEWLFPCAIWSSEYAKPLEDHPELAIEMRSNVYVTADQGASFLWRGGADVSDRAFDEHRVIEKLDGSLWMLVRTQYGIGQSFSYDGGKTWSSGEPSGISGPNSRFFIQRLSSGRLLLVNHVNPRYTSDSGKYKIRNNLTAMLSEDDGITWIGGLMLDNRDNVSYPDGTEDENGVIYIVYDHERYKDREILLASFSESDILAGTCISKDAHLRILVSKATGMTC